MSTPLPKAITYAVVRLLSATRSPTPAPSSSADPATNPQNPAQSHSGMRPPPTLSARLHLRPYSRKRVTTPEVSLFAIFVALKVRDSRADRSGDSAVSVEGCNGSELDAFPSLERMRMTGIGKR